eukprot:TRINITY_DN9417_c1_g3_i1.p1 TRINITY_DN9417_c1_g3~~TRINITY_DN9417_c1_g3_i1.p1  ORF type:complete len:456 (-),score=42.24 TRINITY_DN9417_c1_g3_i1:354-1520(-)
MESTITLLKTSLSRTLHHFFPLTGRLATIKHDDASAAASSSVFIDCNGEGALFILAAAAHVTVSDILSPIYVPPVVNSFFPLNKPVNYDAQSLPLLAVQVTELADGIFISCSLNHVVCDGTSFWNFFNSWSEIARGATHISSPPTITRWFSRDGCTIVRLPFTQPEQYIVRYTLPPLREGFFQFSPQSIERLKAKANAECNTDRISSLQAVLAHVWRSVTRARNFEADQETSYRFPVGTRSRLRPPLPENYLGNAIQGSAATCTAGELMEQGLGWAAWLLNQSMDAVNDGEVRGWLDSWVKKPKFLSVGNIKPSDLVMSSSSRFKVYSNDFGWGKPLTVRSGPGNKFDGKITVYPGTVKGAMALEICLSPDTLSTLIADQEFMEEATV